MRLLAIIDRSPMFRFEARSLPVVPADAARTPAPFVATDPT